MAALRLAVLILFLVAGLVACSRVELVYENADWLGARQIAGYLDLDRTQRLAVRDALQDYREFHRRERLPQLVAFLDLTDAVLDAESVDRDRLATVFDDGERLLTNTAEDLIPMAAETLRGLSAGQIEALEKTLAEGREDYAEEVLPERAQRNIERIENWTGQLGRGQRAHLENCDARLPDVTEEWLQWRERRDREFIALLRATGSKSEIEEFLRDWWLNSEARSRPLRQARETSRQVWLECSETLLATLTPAQTAQIRSRLQGYRGNFATLAALGD